MKPLQVGSTALRQQGRIFCVVALVGLLATPWLSRLNDRTLLISVAVAILFLGIPHGALDTVFAQTLYRVRTPLHWLIFIVAYVLLACLVVGVWWSMPRTFLVGFLLISAFHFSADPDIALSIGARMLYGGAVIILPTMRYAPQVTALFAQLIGQQAGTDLVAPMQWLSVPLLVGDLLLIAMVLRTDRLAATEILAVVLLAVFAPPLVAFTLFFCGMHSPRHFLRTALLAALSPRTLLLRVALIPTVTCLAASGLALVLWSDQPLEIRLVRIIFVGLAALTVPHMFLVERVRYRRC